jgi:predicted nucleic acid-binding protein
VLIPAVTLSELAFLADRAGGTRAVIMSMRALRQSAMEVTDPQDPDYERALAILEKYHDSRIDFVDACIMALAERLNVTRILTFDRRDFGLYRPAHCPHFELLP